MSTPQQIFNKTSDFQKISIFKQQALVTGCFTGDYFNTTPGETAELGDEETTGLVSGAIDRGSGQSNLEFLSLQADNLVATGSGLDIEKNFDTCVGLPQAGQLHLRMSSSPSRSFESKTKESSGGSCSRGDSGFSAIGTRGSASSNSASSTGASVGPPASA